MEVLASSAGPFEWAVASTPAPGEFGSGDLATVFSANGTVLIAVVDGLGHGQEATAAAQTALTTARSHARESLPQILNHCHSACRRTRGVAMSVGSYEQGRGTMAWLGVGNVEGLVFRVHDPARMRRESLLLQNGVVGYALPSLRPSILPLSSGDVLVMATDGVRSWLIDGFRPDEPVRVIAEQILTRCASGTDDALVLVARLGEQPHGH